MGKDNVVGFVPRGGNSRPSGYIGDRSQGPGGPGDGGDMEVKVARLETQMGHVQAELGEVKARLGKVEDKLNTIDTKVSAISGKISNLPGWPGLLTITGIIIAAVGLIVRFLPAAGTP